MHPDGLRQILEAVRSGSLAVPEALERLARWPSEDLAVAKVDHHRTLRCGFPEVIFCPGKSTEDVLRIARAVVDQGSPLLATRVAPEVAAAVLAAIPDAVYHERARVLTRRNGPAEPGVGCVLVVSAGTADIPVAEEARLTAEIMGARVETLFDVGVAGLHRLLAHAADLRRARVIVVVAGMEGALPSVVSGLVDLPVIAVPTSTGYGASFGGVAALLAMLNSCAAGVTVVNIDNGFGAGFAAARMNAMAEAKP